MKLSKIVVITITAVLCVIMLVTGCGSSTPKATDKPKYPTKTITIIVPMAPGGSSDLIARAMAKVSVKYLGQSMVVINKPGAGGQLGLNELGDSKPDGYTVGIAGSGMLLQPLVGKTKYNYATDLDGVGMVGNIPYVLAVRSDSRWKTLEEFISYAKANPGKVKYGHSGVGGATHTPTEQLALLAGIKLEPVPFEGGAPLLISLLGGHIDAVMNNPVDMQEQIKAGKIRALAVAGEARIDDPLYKDIPTLKEKGYEVVSILRLGFAAPKGIPQETLAVLRSGFEKMANDPETVQAIKQLGLVPKYLKGEDFSAQWISEQNKLKKTLEETGILQMIREQKK